MRTIKFRGQTVDTKELIYGDLIQTEKDFKSVVEILDWSKVGCKPKKSLVVNPETVGQFTGLTDKNGVEIYEGDILSTETLKHMQVGWNNRFSSFSLTHKDWAFSHWFGESCEPEQCLVVGNIFENPELLQ